MHLTADYFVYCVIYLFMILAVLVLRRDVGLDLSKSLTDVRAEMKSIGTAFMMAD